MLSAENSNPLHFLEHYFITPDYKAAFSYLEIHHFLGLQSSLHLSIGEGRTQRNSIYFLKVPTSKSNITFIHILLVKSSHMATHGYKGMWSLAKQLPSIDGSTLGKGGINFVGP